MATKGLGGIRQRSEDGLWVAQLYINGKRQIRYSKTRDEALENLHRLQSMKRGGMLVDRSGRTTGMYLDEFVKEIAPQQGLRPKTLECYENTIRLHIVPYLGHIRLTNLTSQDIYKWLGAMYKDGASPRMRQLAHSVLSSALKHAMPGALNYINQNPILGVKAPKAERKAFEVWNTDQTRHFLTVNVLHPLYVLFFMALAMGMRQGEILGLVWKDVDLDLGTISVKKTLLELRGKVVGRFDVKSKKSRRIITMPQSLVAALRAHKAKCGSSPWVFSVNGEPLTKAQVVAEFESATEAAALPRIRFHDLRHTCNTLLLSKGTHTKVMQERAGHAQYAVTMDVYAHYLPAMDVEAAVAMEAIVAR